MKKQLNPLQRLIDEMHQHKKLHSQLAKNAESENNRHNSNYVHFEQGVAYGFELAIEILAKFNFWNNARTNPPKFDGNRISPYYTKFVCVAKYRDIVHCFFTEGIYDFHNECWACGDMFEVLYWQEYSVIPKELLR